MSAVRLLAVADAPGARVVPNAELLPALGVDDGWVRTRTGIRERRFADPGQGVVEMAEAASAKALATAGVDPATLDLIMVATCTLPSPIPAAAPQLAARLGSSAAALDLNTACSGFCSALALAADSVRAGTSRSALVVGAERLSDWLDLTDRGTAMIFGDGAGAAVLAAAPDDQPDDQPDDVGPVVWGSDGTGGQAIVVAPWERVVHMDGRAVFRWATTSIAPVAREACRRAGVELDELAAFVPHQANLRIVDALTRALELPPSVLVSDDVTTAGNTSAASVPGALARLLATGEVPPGAPVLLCAFGGGLSWAAQVVRAPAA